MEKIITLENGRMFKIDSPESLTPEYESIIIDKLKSTISGLASGCGEIKKGTSKNIKASASGGTGKYYFELYINNSKVADSGTNFISTSSLPYIFPYTFNTIGSINVMIKAKDDCGGAAFSNDSCTVTVTDSVSTLSTIELTGCDASHIVGDDCTITPTCKDSSGTIITCPTLTWSSSSPSKVSVESTTNNKGFCKFLAEGSSTIKASSGDVSGSKTVSTESTISKPILISHTPSSVKVGDSFTHLVTGSNFDDNANVYFENIEGLYQLGSTEGKNPTRTSTLISWDAVQGNYPGTFNVYVKNGNGQKSDNTLKFTVLKESDEQPQKEMGMGLVVLAGVAIGYLLSKDKSKPSV